LLSLRSKPPEHLLSTANHSAPEAAYPRRTQALWALACDPLFLGDQAQEMALLDEMTLNSGLLPRELDSFGRASTAKQDYTA
jgi:hypothetical protein